MIRRFPEHRLRPVTDLRGVWDFVFLGDAGPEAVAPGDLAFDDLAAVPGSWDATPRYAGRRGLAAYRTRVPVSRPGRHRLILDGLHHWARVWANGQPVGDHAGGFTRVAFDMESGDAAEAEIVVLTDNRIDYDRAPTHLHYFDWYHFGGLTRGGEWQALGDAWIDSLRVDTLDHEARRLRVRLTLAGDSGGPRPLSLRFQGQEILRRDAEVAGEPVEVVHEFEASEADLWSPANPALHHLEARFGDDDLNERVGIRTVSVKGRDISLNGEPLRLRGFNRHEGHPQFGHGQPDQLLITDLQLLEDMGCNFVRGSHYPQDVRFLDLCDERGILVWNEGTAWQQTAAHLTDEHYLTVAERNLTEMVADAANRPCVILWGLLNESESQVAASRSGYERLIRHLRALDATRPVTFATNHPFDDRCLDLADVVSINTYPGWYTGPIKEIPERLIEITDYLDAQPGAQGKPFILSEIGAGGIPGWRDWNQGRWTETYQARLLETVVGHVNRPGGRWMGLAIWQFCDVRTTEWTAKALGRPRAFNNKGVVDEYRRPKEAYAVVRKGFTEG